VVAIATVCVAVAGDAGASASVGSTTLYVTDSNSGTVTPVDAMSRVVGTPIAVGSVPTDIAITPDGTTAYVANWGGTVTPVALDSNTAGTPIPIDGDPMWIAITPDGAKAYVANVNKGTVTPIELATNTPGSPINLGKSLTGIAITPDGSTAYVTRVDTNSVGSVIPIELATNTPGTAIPVAYPASIAIAPDGSTGYVVSGGTYHAVTPINLTNHAVGTPISVSDHPVRVAVTPDGSRLYVTHFYDAPGGLGGSPPPPPTIVTPIDTASMTAGPPITVGPNPLSIAFTADGSTAYVTVLGDTHVPDDSAVVPIDVATNTVGTPIVFGQSLFGIAIRPEPEPTDTTAPTVAFGTSPTTASGANGMWFNAADLPAGGTLSVTASADDGDGSGVASVSCTVNNGTAQTANGTSLALSLANGVHNLACTATDNDGNTSPAVTATYRVDTTAPTLAPTVSGSGPDGTVLLGDPAATPSANASDGTAASGINTANCAGPAVSAPGLTTVTCSASDIAGNSATGTGSYLVHYKLLGFYSPTSEASYRPGTAIPIEIALANAQNSFMTACAGCTVAVRAQRVGTTGQEAGPFTMKYDATSKHYKYVWKTSKTGTGPTDLRVTVTYPSTTLVTTKTTQVTIK
jgi:DNA-binding beta-propeller fold protein YncE